MMGLLVETNAGLLALKQVPTKVQMVCLLIAAAPNSASQPACPALLPLQLRWPTWRGCTSAGRTASRQPARSCCLCCA